MTRMELGREKTFFSLLRNTLALAMPDLWFSVRPNGLLLYLDCMNEYNSSTTCVHETKTFLYSYVTSVPTELTVTRY